MLAQLKPGDSIIVALVGHGVLMLVPADKPEEKPHPKSFFCPMDANLARKQLPRFIDFDELYKALADSPATVKLLLVDACRNELLAQPEGRPGGIEMPAPPPPPASVAALFSCSEKEVSWEDSELDGGHGVFFHYVIQGFSGKADEWERGNHNHKVELDELYSYVKDNVLAFVAHKHFTAQRPRLVGDLGPVDLLDISTRSSGRDLVTTRVGQIKLKRIPAGTFQMGSPAGEGSEDEHPQHEVRITRPFYLGVTEVSQAQYEAVMGNNPSDFSAAGGGKDKVAGQSTGELPVETVSWLDAVKFCNKLSELEGRRPFYEIAGETVRVPDWKASGYRLPTEAEWEYACGGDPANLDEHAWLGGYSGAMPHPAGKKLANRFGLHDMLGNVWEWCWDAYDKDYYKQSPRDDPTGPDAAGAASRVVRGGCWGLIPRYCRSAYRKRFTPVFQHGALGFRLALVQ
ncbi:MAG: SUMF1/EgtB/PvdO family nonheme iron enzyme [Isosphaeraceae bacterium]